MTAKDLVKEINADGEQRLIAEVNRLHNLVVEADQTSLEKAIEAGILLNALKKHVKHGDWLPYLAENFPTISERTAQDYMWAATNAGKIEEAQKKSAEEGANPNPQRAALLTSIRGAKEALKKPKSEQSKAKPRRAIKSISPATHGPVTAPIDEQLEDLDVDEVVPALKEKWDGDQRKQLIVSLLEELSIDDVADILSDAFPDRLENLIKALEGEEVEEEVETDESDELEIPPSLQRNPDVVRRA
jgi:hypothetical protein